jgi:predicted thioesterase
MAYRVVRTLPDGTVKTSPTTVKTKRLAAIFAGVSLHDNTGASKVEAQRFSIELAALPLGTDLTHASGYRFRVESID